MKKFLYLGPDGSYTQQAMHRAITLLHLNNCETEEHLLIGDIINAIENNNNIAGIIPVENSIEGIVRESADKLIRTDNIKIFQEIIVPISHCLVNSNGNIHNIKTIISHPQALAQCSDYIENLSRKLNRHIETMPVSSTSMAAKSLNEYDETFAAISNIQTAKMYERKILDTNINDEKDNKTRFICIGNFDANKTNNDTTSFAFTTLNQSGALVNVLEILKEYNLNMSHIDSRPSKKVLGEYLFFIDIDGHITDTNVKEAIEKIKPVTTFYKFLGSYPKYNEANND